VPSSHPILRPAKLLTRCEKGPADGAQSLTQGAVRLVSEQILGIHSLVVGCELWKPATSKSAGAIRAHVSARGAYSSPLLDAESQLR
jgi:hypothetical protein